MITAIQQIYNNLPNDNRLEIDDVIKCMLRSVEYVQYDSNLIGPCFASVFTRHLKLWHRTTINPLSEEAFLYALRKSFEACGSTVTEPLHHNHKGEDITVDITRISLKKETGLKVSQKYIRLSKMMEAGWSKQKHATTTVIEKIMAHLKLYDLIIVLRAYRSINKIVYELVEVPKEMLCEASKIKPTDFGIWKNGKKIKQHTIKKSRSAYVPYKDCPNAWRIFIDGSDTKIVFDHIDTSFCITHAQWIVQL